MISTYSSFLDFKLLKSLLNLENLLLLSLSSLLGPGLGPGSTSSSNSSTSSSGGGGAATTATVVIIDATAAAARGGGRGQRR